MKRYFAAAALAAFATTAFAHSDQPHAPKAVDYSKAEETPFGKAADPKTAGRTVKIEMRDEMRFSPAQITVRRGEVVRFAPVNKGQVVHEMVLGTMDDLKKHAALMKKFPNMEHDEPNMAHVAPGKTGQMGWQFTKAGEFYYGCLEPGHFEAGMIGKVIVVADDGPRERKGAPQAQSDSSRSAQSQGAGSQSASALSEGEIRKVDKGAKKITIKHGPLKNLDMPAMTMVFQVKDPAMLAQVKAGDRVRFEAENVNGALTIMQIEPAK